MPIYDISGNSPKAYDIDGNEVSGKEIIIKDAKVGFVTAPEYIDMDGGKYRLVWKDEFDEKDIDKNYWTDSYLVSNVENMYQAQADYYIADSILHMRIKKDAPSRGTAADTAQSCIQSGEYNNAETGVDSYHDVHPFWGLLTQEGYYEMRMKPWKATGGCCNVWWMMEIQDAKLQKASLGGRGEFDIIEYLPMNPTVYPHGQHKNSNEALTERYVNTDVGIDLTNDYHVIGFLWKNGTLVFYLDGNVIDTFSNISTPQTPMYHLLSAYKYFGTGTDWKGPADRSLDTRDVTWDIDYIRIYKKADTVQTTNVTIDRYAPVTIDGNTADMEIDSRRGCPYEFPSYVYIYWSDGTRTEHWVKWDAIKDTYQTKMTNQESFEWGGYVYGLGIEIVANVNYN